MFGGIFQAINSVISASIFADQPVARTQLTTLVFCVVFSGMFGICAYGLSVTTDLFPFPDIRLSGFDTGAMLCFGCFVTAGMLLLRQTAYRRAGGSLRVLSVIYIEVPVAFILQMAVLDTSPDTIQLLGSALIIGSAFANAYMAQAQAHSQAPDAKSQEEPVATAPDAEHDPLLTGRDTMTA